MTVASTCKRRRRQAKLDARYGARPVAISKKISGRARLLAMREKSARQALKSDE